jgi:5'-nucleotidase
VKIGVFGLSPKLEGMVASYNCPGVKYLDPAKVAEQTATMLKRDMKCDVVICISHLGWECIHGEDDLYMIKGSRNIDLVLGGHTHSFFETLHYETDLDGKRVPDDQNGKHGIFVGKMVMKLHSK